MLPELTARGAVIDTSAPQFIGLLQTSGGAKGGGQEDLDRAAPLGGSAPACSLGCVEMALIPLPGAQVQGPIPWLGIACYYLNFSTGNLIFEAHLPSHH